MRFFCMRYAVACGFALTLTAVAQVRSASGVSGGATVPSSALAVAYVSAAGSDAKPCTQSAPCRQISRALSVVAAGGQVVVLTSAEFQPITVLTTVSIIAPDGVYAGIASSASHPVTISAGAADIVTLRGLTLNGGGGNLSVVFVVSGNVDIQNCVINNGAIGVGITGTSTAIIKNTSFTSNVSVPYGVYSQSTQPVVIDSCKFYVSVGVFAVAGAQVTVKESTVVGDGTAAGYEAATGSSLVIENSVATNNAVGILSSDNSVVYVSNSTVTNNATGISTTGSDAQILSRGNNTVAANTSNGAFTGSFPAQ
jgi:hypothetical protein